MQVLQELRRFIPSLPLATDVAEHYGCVRNKLESKGKRIGNNDLWIAVHALSLDIVVVTNNENEFKRVPHLKVENWS